MLEIRPNCECCGRDLAPDVEAYICTFECTWCPSCVAKFEGAAARTAPGISNDVPYAPLTSWSATRRPRAGWRALNARSATSKVPGANSAPQTPRVGPIWQGPLAESGHLRNIGRGVLRRAA